MEPILKRLRTSTILLLLCLPLSVNAQLQVQASNLTSGRKALESTPRFVLDDTKVVFLEFCGIQDDPEPWDFRVAMMDIDGGHSEYLTGPGVVAYSLMDGHTLRLLRNALKEENILLASQNDSPEWEICQLDLLTRNVSEIATTRASLAAAYDLMETGGNGLYGEVVTDGTYHYYNLYHSNAGDSPVFRTELYKSYGDVTWQPEVVWETERHFITLAFESAADARFPQNEGVFSIVRVDIENGSERVLQVGAAAFPRFSLDSRNHMLYFQKESGLAVELWRLNLLTGESQRLYSTIGSLGKPSVSGSGNQLVVTQQVGDDFEIVRLEIGAGEMTMVDVN